MAVFRRVLGAVSDGWFAFRVWVRYDMLWTSSGRSVLALAFCLPVVVAGALLRSESAVLGSGSGRPVALPLTTLPASQVSTSLLSGGVLMVGDSLVAGEEDVYASAFAAVGVDVVFDAAVSRGLRRGWLCPSGSSRFSPTHPVGSGDEPDDGLDEFQEDVVGDDDIDNNDIDNNDIDNNDIDNNDIDNNDIDNNGIDSNVAGGEDTELVEDLAPGDGLDPSEGDGCQRQGLEALAWYASSGDLPPSVVVALGTNDASRTESRVRADLAELRGLLGGRKVFIVATATYPMREAHSSWNDTARRWCTADGLCEFVEWVPGDQAALFAPDGVHLNARGALERARAIASAVVSPR